MKKIRIATIPPMNSATCWSWALVPLVSLPLLITESAAQGRPAFFKDPLMWAGLLAGTALALTPVAVLMFRFNNPDSLLTLLLIGSVHATVRAIETPQRAVRWLVLGGSLVGFAFLTKMMQAFLARDTKAETD